MELPGRGREDDANGVERTPVCLVPMDHGICFISCLVFASQLSSRESFAIAFQRKRNMIRTEMNKIYSLHEASGINRIADKRCAERAALSADRAMRKQSSPVGTRASSATSPPRVA